MKKRIIDESISSYLRPSKHRLRHLKYMSGWRFVNSNNFEQRTKIITDNRRPNITTPIPSPNYIGHPQIGYHGEYYHHGQSPSNSCFKTSDGFSLEGTPGGYAPFMRGE